MDKLRALQYFVKVAETKSFSQAATSFGVPASSISRRIQDLEADIGVTLLIRTTRVVRLTELGQLYLEQVSRAIDALNHADALVRDRPGSPSGLLRITSTPGYGRFLLMPAIRKLRRKYPELVIDVELTDTLADLLGEGVDLAIRATAQLPDRAIARKLSDNDYVLVASPDYLMRRETPSTIADLSDHPALLYRGPNRIVEWQAHAATGWSTVTLHPTFICNVGEELVQEAVAGKGLALLPRWGAQRRLDSKELIKIDLEDAELSLSRETGSGIFLLYHQPKYRLKKVKAAVDFLVSELASGQGLVNPHNS